MTTPPTLALPLNIVPRGRPVCDSIMHYGSCCVGPLATDASWTCQYCQRRYDVGVSGGYTKRETNGNNVGGHGRIGVSKAATREDSTHVPL